MKTDNEIKDDIYRIIQGSSLPTDISGVVTRHRRPINSEYEDIVISVVSNINGQIQEAIVNVNIYVPSILNEYNEYEEDGIRTRALSKTAQQVLNSYHGGSFYMKLESQHIEEYAEGKVFVINNRLYYKQNNE